ncbi:MAG: hypothetical protein KDK24_17505 [Pseudooceanicola sp.]|nr:hypothetical protein [Pseudooceanicola sp.]
MLVPVKGDFPKVTLTAPDGRGYLLLALTVDRRPPFLYPLASRAKRQATDCLRRLAAILRACSDVEEANLFTAVLRPPGRGKYLARLNQRPAAHDLVLLAAFRNEEAASAFAGTPEWTQALARTVPLAQDHLAGTYSNIRHIAPVPHDKGGIFLFNWFAAADTGQNLAVWEHTAGWFQDQTGLDNSTVLLPSQPDPQAPTIVNHCRWDGLTDILPALVLKPSFRSFVLAGFAANRTAAQPVLYRMIDPITA